MKLYVQEIIDFIEENIHEEINVDDVSKHIGYSKFYLNKCFSIFTGYSIMYYVRKRKLEYSIVDLNESTPIVDIAFKYGFNSRRAYTRLFTAYLGKSPSHYRNQGNTLRQKLILEDLGGIKMLAYLSDAKVVKLNKLYALARRVISKNPEDDVIKLQTEYKLENKLNVLHEVGFDIPVTEDEQAQGIRGYEYWLCVDKKVFDNIESDVPKKIEAPKSKYLMLSIKDPFSKPFERIPNGWKKLVSEMQDKYEVNQEVGIWGFEEVVNSLHETKMNIYIPIK